MQLPGRDKKSNANSRYKILNTIKIARIIDYTRETVTANKKGKIKGTEVNDCNLMQFCKISRIA